MINKVDVVLFAIEHQHLMNKEIASLINQKFGLNMNDRQVSRLRQKHNFPSTNNGRFKKGNIPFSKGTKGLMKPNSSSFKKGNKPSNQAPIGTEVIKTDGYIWVKVNDNPGSHNKAKRWKQKSHIVYEQHHNIEIKSDERVVHLNQDKLDTSINNLVLVNTKHLAVMNRSRTITDFAQLNSIAITTAKIKCAISELNRGI